MSGDRVSFGNGRWSSSDSESSARSYSEVARTPPAARNAAPASASRSAAPAPPASGPVVAAARLPAKARIGPRSEVHRVAGGDMVDADGFQQPRRKNRRRHRRAPEPEPALQRPRSPSPEAIDGLCFRCLDHRHRVRDCKNDIRCRRCLISGHDSRGCEDFHRRNGRAPPKHPQP
ncbi:hypothetical protein D1007_59886 [Hordeum vulgare]|nr:hypothetical protein D1007_59886 [Hordeum vulgare]